MCLYLSFFQNSEHVDKDTRLFFSGKKHKTHLSVIILPVLNHH